MSQPIPTGEELLDSGMFPGWPLEQIEECISFLREDESCSRLLACAEAAYEAARKRA